jgi:hypothetical protein
MEISQESRLFDKSRKGFKRPESSKAPEGRIGTNSSEVAGTAPEQEETTEDIEATDEEYEVE